MGRRAGGRARRALVAAALVTASLAGVATVGRAPVAGAATGAAATAAWRKVTPATSPTAHTTASMAYDTATGQLILFGGDTPSGFSSTTWVWTGSTWEKLNPTNRPAARGGGSMAYDPATGRLILFGGYDEGLSNAATEGYLATTWAWTGTDWTELTPSTHPAGRAGASMAYDPVTGEAVLFGGSPGLFGYLGTTWAWNGTTWTKLPATPHPRRRAGAVMAYDPSHGDAVLFGGVGPTTTKPCTTGVCTLTYSTTWELAPAPTVAITPSPLTLTYGAETAPSFTVAVVGSAALGYPEGTVTLETGTTAVPVSCTASGTHATTDTATFTCRLPSATELQGGAHSAVTAVFTPGTPSSSKAGYSYRGASSPPATFNVKKILATTTARLTSIPATLTYGSETGPGFDVVVTGQPGRGYPEGTIVLTSSTRPVHVVCLAYASATTTHSTTLRLSPGVAHGAPGWHLPHSCGDLRSRHTVVIEPRLSLRRFHVPDGERRGRDGVDDPDGRGHPQPVDSHLPPGGAAEHHRHRHRAARSRLSRGHGHPRDRGDHRAGRLRRDRDPHDNSGHRVHLPPGVED